MRNVVWTFAAATLLLGACDTLPTDVEVPEAEAHRTGGNNNSGPYTYEITIENLTEGQPLSPGVIVAHTRRARLFKVGRHASEGIRLIAENGDPSTAVADLAGAHGVLAVEATTAPVGCVGCPGPFASSLTVEITAPRNARFLSAALMLICTNDGFAGLNRVRLPRRVGQTRTVHARAYDSGTEANDELWDSIVDPCGGIGPVAGPQDGTNDRPATHQRIRRHRGIRGVGDLTSDHRFRHRVAHVTITRTS